MQFIWEPLFNILIVFYHLFFNNLGIAVLVFTGFIKLLLTPLTNPSMKNMQKMKEYAPHLAKLKKKYAKDKKKLMQAQADFYKEKGINPAAGCLPYILNIVILIAMFQGFNNVFTVNAGAMENGGIAERFNNILYSPLKLTEDINIYFFGQDLTKPNVFNVPGLPIPLPGVFVLLSAGVQFLASKMTAPATKQAKKVASGTKGEFDDVATSMQQQMIILFPLLTVYLGYVFPLVLILFWGALSVFQAIQQYFISGWGGLSPLVNKIKRV